MKVSVLWMLFGAAHDLNATNQTLTVEARINMWTIPKDQMVQEAGILFYYDPFIRVPAMSPGNAEMACPSRAAQYLHRRQVQLTPSQQIA